MRVGDWRRISLARPGLLLDFSKIAIIEVSFPSNLFQIGLDYLIGQDDDQNPVRRAS